MNKDTTATAINPAPAAEPKAVLRYWLAMVRQEEILGSQIKVAVSAPRAAPDLRNPNAGQSYIKLLPREIAAAPTDGLSERQRLVAQCLLKHAEPLEFPVSGERVPFLEHVLNLEQRRSRDAAFNRDNVDVPACSIGFPTFHANRKRTLSTLLRFQVDMPTWRDATGHTWNPPDYRARKATAALLPPATLALGDPLKDDSESLVLPYHLDTYQLSQTLGVLEDHANRLLDTLATTERLSPSAMVAAVTALVASSDDTFPDAAITAALAPAAALGPPEDLLAALFAAVESRLDPRSDVRVYPFGLLWDGSVTLTTRGLQQDLTELLASPPPTAKSPLGAWLLADPPARLPGLHIGLRSPTPLTTDQRAAAEQAHRGVLTVASGPPGTGKTELILNIAAHTIIERTVALARGGSPDLAEPMVVTSTNNRAVDNVIDPLCHNLPGDRLPLALRVGSRLVLKEITVATLDRVRRWFDDRRETATAAATAWAELGPLLISEYDACADQLRLHQSSAIHRANRPLLDARRAELTTWLAAWPAPAWHANQLDIKRLSEVSRAVFGLTDSVRRIGIDHATSDTATVSALWDTWHHAHIARITHDLAELGVPLAAPAPPSNHTAAAHAFTQLSLALEAAHNILTARIDTLLPPLPPGCNSRDDATLALAEVEQKLAECDAPMLPPETLAHAEYELFRLATEAREAWASMRRAELAVMLSEVMNLLRESPHMLKVFLEDVDHARLFFSLFPVLGCTLLSIPNTFVPARNNIGLAVIDEAGQCHPAYAVSALLRARRALIIGDVHQLEPVIGLDDHEENRVLLRISNLGFPDQGSARRALSPFRATATAGRSVQSIAARAAVKPLVLHDHFRCQPAIIAISEALCSYGLRVRTPPATLTHRTRHLPGPLILHDIRGLQTSRGGSWHNAAEVDRVGDLVRALMRDGVTPAQIAVLTPYRGQLAAIRQRLRDDRVPLDDDTRETETVPSLFSLEPVAGLALGTVHRFQGGERDVVIFSTVLTAPAQLPFLNDRVNLVNVAVSRARQHLVVIGHAEMLARGPITRSLVTALTTRIGP